MVRIDLVKGHQCGSGWRLGSVQLQDCLSQLEISHTSPEATLQIELVPFYCFPRIFCFGFYFSALGSIILAYKQ